MTPADGGSPENPPESVYDELARILIEEAEYREALADAHPIGEVLDDVLEDIRVHLEDGQVSK